MPALARLVLVLLMGSPAGAPPAVTVTLQQEAVVDAAEVQLADVAAVTGGPASLVARVAAVALGRAPDPGMERAVTRRFLSTRLRQERLDPTQVAWAGPQTARVSRLCARIPGATIAQAAIAELRRTLPWPDEDLIVDVQRPPADVHLLGTLADLHYAVSVRPGQRLLGSVPVDITISRDGRAVGRATAVLGVRVFQRMVVTRRRIRRGEIITKDVVRLQRAELTSPGNDVATDLAEALGREARRDIPAFAALSGRMVAAARVVRRGALVRLTARRGRMTITALGFAEQDGAVGQLIRVRNKDSRKTVHGRVVDARTVEVPF